ncbi:MAG: hypothetical protein LC117_00080 [Bacteroidia bacterium]|nr:hypothetical protein [Bacteroidia bacterium]
MLVSIHSQRYINFSILQELILKKVEIGLLVGGKITHNFFVFMGVRESQSLQFGSFGFLELALSGGKKQMCQCV